jgi:endo-alpha-1,4-polygalactosaminidase (GH114 family)
MKKMLLFAIICIIIGGLYYIYTLRSNPLRTVDTYRIYYGEIDGKILADMNKFDMVIVEASLFDKRDVEKLKENEKTKVFGYISVMEIGNWDNEILASLNTADFLTIDGERVENGKCQNFLGDISQTHYRQTLLNTLEARILAKGMDGVFLDTTDWIDQFGDNKAVHEKLVTGYEQFLKDVKSRFPEIIIIQNRGFSCFNKVGYKYIDGFLWEDFNTPLGQNKDFEQRVNELKILTEEHGVKVFSVSYENEAQNKAFASQMGWTHLQHDSTYYDVWR